MTEHYIYASVTRILDKDKGMLSIAPIDRKEWRAGDYVVGEVINTEGRLCNIELCNGRIVECYQGDYVVGAFGKRSATLEAVGDWQAIEDDLYFEALTPAGLFGKTTSHSDYLSPLVTLKYRGHLMHADKSINMHDCVDVDKQLDLDKPVILIIGTSMSAGKTTAGKIIIHQLNMRGFRVAGIKLTGAARYRDVLSYADAGADYIYDFVDAGLPSTVCDENEFVDSVRLLLSKLAALDIDVVVAEAGASPLEPYNGATAFEQISDNICFTILCASDPYAVAGVAQAFGHRPDLVAGGAANTSAGIALVKKLTGLDAANIQDKASLPQLMDALTTAIKNRA